MVIAAPIIAIVYVFSTSSVQALIPSNEPINIVGTVQQVLEHGLGQSGRAGLIVAIASLALMFVLIATISVVFVENARLPMTAGWDYLLPQWFTKLHPEHKTPVNSIIFTATIALILGLGGLIGEGYQRAFLVLLNTSFVLWALTYMVMFAIPLIGSRRIGPRPSFWVKIAAASGFIMTLLYVSFSILPILEESRWLLFAIKITSVVIATNILGVLMLISARRRQGGKEVSFH